MTDGEGLYQIALVGVRETYNFLGAPEAVHCFATVYNTLGDVTGYKSEYIKDRLTRMEIGERREVFPAQNWSEEMPSVPFFFVERVA